MRRGVARAILSGIFLLPTISAAAGPAPMRGMGDLLHSIFLFLPLSIALMFICRQFAKEKHKNVTLWTVLGVIPAVNLWALIYLMGAANTLRENKLDRVLAILEKEA